MALTQHHIAAQSRFYDALMASQFWPEAQLVALQRRRLAALLDHAHNEAPFYRDRLKAALRPDGGINWHGWADIPPLTRSDLLTHGAELHARRVPAGHGRRHDFATSGSTGLPVTVRSTLLANLFSQANFFRGQHWHGVDWSGDCVSWVGENPERGHWPEGERRGRWGPLWQADATGNMWELQRETAAEHVLEFAKRKGARYLTNRPQRLQSLALTAIRAGIKLPLHRLLAFSTAALSDEREDCHVAFGAPIVVSYGSKEAGLIAFQCPAHEDRLHVSAESILVEIVGDNNRPVAPGVMGRVLVTPLFSFAQPLIRYEQGDLAIAGEPCDCGRTLPVLARVVGRSTNLFRFPDGTRLAPSLPEDSRALIGADYWQIARTGPLSIEVRYVAPADATAEGKAAFAVLALRHLRPDLAVSFSRYADFERTPGGKFMQYVCELPADV